MRSSKISRYTQTTDSTFSVAESLISKHQDNRSLEDLSVRCKPLAQLRSRTISLHFDTRFHIRCTSFSRKLVEEDKTPKDQGRKFKAATRDLHLYSLGDNTMGDQDIGPDVENEPQVSLNFNSENEAYEFYNSYGGRMGFSIRRGYAHWSKKDKSILTSRRFVCSKQGLRKKDKQDSDTINPRAETRTDCPARMGIVLVDNGQYQCNDFVEEHNHLLHLPATLHMMRSQRKVLDSYAVGRQAGGRENLWYTKHNYLEYLPTKRQRDLAFGEAGGLLIYFQNQKRVNPFFTYALQYDSLERITNILWTDPEMLIDYAQFGDVVTFHTTFSTNKEYRPFGVFAGINHHGGICIFGAALLYDETLESFKWLFEAFLEVHAQKKPLTIFTDQDATMEKAISEVLPDTWHGLCTWHIMQNGIKHLGNLMKDGSSFLEEFKTCMFHYKGVLEFENAWEKLRCDYSVKDSSWLDHIYGLKEKWANCYMKKTFTIGMRSTRLSESLNGDLKAYLKSSLDLMQFFKHFEGVVNDKRNNELKAEFDARNKMPSNVFPMSPVMRQALKVYTPFIFEDFQEEFMWISACYIKSQNESAAIHEYVVAIVEREGDFNVMCNPSNPTIACSCKKFETFGILCCHALKILDLLDIKFIPETYVLRRWTRAARDTIGNQVEKGVNLDHTQRYRIVSLIFSWMLLKVSKLEASKSAEGYALLDRLVEDMWKKLQNLAIVKEQKRKEARKGGKRLKNWVEKQGNRKKTVKTNTSQTSHLIQPSAPSQASLLMGSFNYSQPSPVSSQSSSSTVHHTHIEYDNSGYQSFVGSANK